MKFLDCFCGMGGVSEGFASEGFDVTGIDIVDAPKMLGYKYHFIQANMLTLRGGDFRGFDVIWGSPPCRDFTILNDARWKIKKNPQHGLELVDCFIKFVAEANPKLWIMENVVGLEKYVPVKPTIHKSPIGKYMKRSFWGNFPTFLMPTDLGKFKMRESCGWDKLAHWERARIPFPCSQAFAKACKEELEKT